LGLAPKKIWLALKKTFGCAVVLALGTAAGI